MSNDNKIVKSVAFNKKNKDDQRILRAIARRNFNKFMKTAAHFYLDHLEKMKMSVKQSKPAVEETIEEVEVTQTAAERLEKMKTQLKKTDIPVGPKLFKPQ